MTWVPMVGNLRKATPSCDVISAFLSAVHSQHPVRGLTHNFYRYPARFSPLFARAAIEAFSQTGDVILDPFVGGGTTLVEALALGRHAVGVDINPLAVFLTRVKTTQLSGHDLYCVIDWVVSLPEHLNLHRTSVRATYWQKAGYQRHLPWTIRKIIELALARIQELTEERQQRFARCLLLRVGQWALDCRERIPTASEFRRELFRYLDEFVEGMREFRRAVRKYRSPGFARRFSLCLNRAAAELPDIPAISSLPRRPRLVVTSPPYPGVHVLYHRWNIQGRRESPSPFWIANCEDGRGEAYYTFGSRKQRDLKTYFEEIRSSFEGVRRVLAPGALVIQTLAFSEPDWQTPCFLQAMEQAGFEEVLPQALGLPVDGRLWRSVPGRRWFALIQGNLPTSREVVLFHRPKRS